MQRKRTRFEHNGEIWLERTDNIQLIVISNRIEIHTDGFDKLPSTRIVRIHSIRVLHFGRHFYLLTCINFILQKIKAIIRIIVEFLFWPDIEIIWFKF